MVIVIEALNEFIDEFASILGETQLDPNTFITYTIIMIIIFFIRYEMMDSIKTVECGRKKTQSYILTHLCIELFIAYVIGYSVIKLTSANPENYAVNYIIAPMIGFIIGIFADTKFFIPLEKSTIFNINKKKSKDSGDGDDSNTTVNINIDSVPNIEQDIVLSDTFHPEYASHLDKDIVDTENFDSLIIDSINSLKDAYYSHSISIRDNTRKIEESLDILSRLKESAMNDKKIELKKMIYDCLNRGFATPAENDKITYSYNSYTLLGGNGDIKTLYEDHYLKLEVHEERRKIPRVMHESYDDYAPVCEYGKYDE